MTTCSLAALASRALDAELAQGFPASVPLMSRRALPAEG
jgi:hypothetical protein